MKITHALLAALACAACSSSDATGTPLPTGSAQLAVVNALSSSGAASQLLVDQTNVTLPAAGKSATYAVTAGTHQVILRSASGRQLGTLSFLVDPDSTRTIVITGGSDSAVVSVPGDSAGHPIGGSPGSADRTAKTLLINSAPASAQLDLLVQMAGFPDSLVHFGNFSSQVQPFTVPWMAGTYTFYTAHHGGTTPLRSFVVTMGERENWTIILTDSLTVEGVKR